MAAIVISTAGQAFSQDGTPGKVENSEVVAGRCHRSCSKRNSVSCTAVQSGSRADARRSSSRYNLPMRFTAAFAVFILITAALAQQAPKLTASQPESVAVPVTLDQGRIVIDVDLPLPNGSTERVRGWVDAGNPDLYMS